MSKAPDLSAFPIPRKGGARPIEIDEASQSPASPPPSDEPESPAPSLPVMSVVPQRAGGQGGAPKKPATRVPAAPEVPQPVQSGQMVATTVKLDEDRYLRLADAGRPGPGRLKRRTIQEMMIEALDEWFEKRGL
ncbi:MAG: hypothetical protein ACU0B1_00670 [Thermohalobaculum sp.]